MWRGSACVAGAVQETHESDMLEGPRADFVRGVAFWSIRSSGLLRWFCMTGALSRMTWPHFLVAAEYFRQMERKKSQNLLVWGRELCTQLSIFRRKSPRIALFLMLSTLKIEEANQNFIVFEVFKFNHWGNLAELLHFPCCQVQNMRKSRRMDSFFNLSARQVER